MLQANNRYEQTVRPRIDRIRERYPSCDTLPALCRWLEAGPGDQLARARQFLEWQGDRRAETLLAIVELLKRQGVHTEPQLAAWLSGEDSKTALRSVKFVGPKTVDYLGILVGAERVAVDRHLYAFLEAAGVATRDYAKAQALLNAAADRLGVAPRLLDHSIWRDGAASGARKRASCMRAP